MKKILLILILLFSLFLIVGCQPPSEKSFPFAGGPPEGSPCYVQPGEWHPEQGECPGMTSEMKIKCEEFCTQHPDCCEPGQDGPEQKSGQKNGFGGKAQFTLPNEKEVAQLVRAYPAVIKAVNEGPAIYGQGKWEILSDQTFDKIKETGFNTIQILTINDCTGEKCLMDETSKILLLNDIVKAKQKGLAVWVATELVNAPPGSSIKLPEYQKFKNSYLDFCREIGKLAEEYQVEYLTVNNEPDLFLQEQTQWGSKEQIDAYIIELMPLANSAAEENFKGKIINKITQPRKRSKEVLAASLKNVDIAGVDVGPPISEQLSSENYRKEFDDYQYYASLAEKAGIPWMNAEYWQYNYFETPSDFIKENQLESARVSWEAYLLVKPKGVGYTWNDFSAFNLLHGEEARQAMKKFLEELK